jgi:preprotein translocase subunit SecF
VQTQQLERVHDQAFEIDDTLQRSTFIIKRMLRRTMTDKAVWCLSFLILLCVIFIVVWKFILGYDIKPATSYNCNFASSATSGDADPSFDHCRCLDDNVEGSLYSPSIKSYSIRSCSGR